MGQSGFNMKQNQNDLTLGESHLFQQSKLKSYKCCFYVSPSPIQHLGLMTPVADFSVCYTLTLINEETFCHHKGSSNSHSDPPFLGKWHMPRICLI